MVAARAAVSPTMSPAQQKLMQYLPVAFAIFQVFFLTGLIVYYMAQAVLRIGQQAYITRRFYGHEESLGRQAQRAGDAGPRAGQADGGRRWAAVRARPSATTPSRTTPTAQVVAEEGARRAAGERATKRTTAPKGRPTPTGKAAAARPKSGSPRVDRAAAAPRAAANVGADQRREEP